MYGSMLGLALINHGDPYRSSAHLITLAYQSKIGALKSTLLIFKLVNQKLMHGYKPLP
jgi:hypothetical protein